MNLGALLPARWRADADLLAAALAGDQHAVQVLVDRLMPSAHALAWRLTGSSHEADDAVQEAFLRLWRDGARLEARARVSTWFLTVVRNLCIDRLRRREDALDDALLDSLVDAAPRPDEAHAAQVDAERLRAALSRVPARQRGVLSMWAWQDYDVNEIAQALEIAPNAAHQLLHRARRRLRAEWAALDVLDGSNDETDTTAQAARSERSFVR